MTAIGAREAAQKHYDAGTDYMNSAKNRELDADARQAQLLAAIGHGLLSVAASLLARGLS